MKIKGLQGADLNPQQIGAYLRMLRQVAALPVPVERTKTEIIWRPTVKRKAA